MKKEEREWFWKWDEIELDLMKRDGIGKRIEGKIDIRDWRDWEERMGKWEEIEKENWRSFEEEKRNIMIVVKIRNKGEKGEL